MYPKKNSGHNLGKGKKKMEDERSRNPEDGAW
jgi:hypothetical protein